MTGIEEALRRGEYGNPPFIKHSDEISEAVEIAYSSGGNGSGKRGLQ